VLLPNVSSARFGVVVQMTLVDTSGLLASSSETTSFTVLVDGVHDPIVSSITTNGLMLRINKNDFEVLVRRILVNPIRVQDTQVRAAPTNSLLSSGSQRSLVFELVDTHVGGLTVGSTLGSRSLTASTTDSNSVNNKALLGLVTKTASLVRTRRTRGTVDHIELTILPASNTEQESEHIRLLITRQLFQVLVGTHFYLVDDGEKLQFAGIY